MLVVSSTSGPLLAPLGAPWVHGCAHQQAPIRAPIPLSGVRSGSRRRRPFAGRAVCGVGRLRGRGRNSNGVGVALKLDTQHRAVQPAADAQPGDALAGLEMLRLPREGEGRR